jgi:long-chain acyl-CoA synthetase
MTVEGPGSAARAAARLAKQVEVALATLDLSLPQYRVLAFLSEGSAAASALAGKLAVSRPSVTALVDGLVARGFVTRQAFELDRRRVDHALTAEGRRALDAADRTVEERLARLAAHLPDGQARRAKEGLRLWNQALDRARAQGKSGKPVGAKQ